ncbi:hypothetical protein OSB04_030761 [Centaurea solstitialis]|uniref:Transposase n=1 Tax=Centaurea solstitialis TaxID=347529 RepID=A0AA38STH3_9ASTR|nr:hypothetical protein OSB04_030761 [Centaurea solstitialis]
MTIDKSWITCRRRNSEEFLKGLEALISMAKDHVDSVGRVKCPCKKCVNGLYQELNIVEGHIYRFGFHEHYQKWIYHGEADTPMIEDDVVPTTDELIDVINDVRGENIINEENVDEGISDGDLSGADQEFAELFQEVETELYPGCTWLSSLNFLAKMLQMKVMNKWTNSSFDQLLEFLKFAFPKENTIPASHYEAKKKMRKIGLGYQSIHRDSNTKGKKVAQKVLRYFPLTPRLKRMYSSRHIAKDMTWHATGQSTEDGTMHHPVDGVAWKDFDMRYPNFSEEPRNVRLGLAADGFNPFGNMSQSYSMWPVILTTYNTPPWLCMKESSFMLTLLIPGPKSPGKDIDIFLRPLVDELKMLWTTDTSSCRVMGKTSYVGHRRFLPSNHRWRKSKLFDGKHEKRSPPRRFDSATILQQLAHLPTLVAEKHPRFGGVKLPDGFGSNFKQKVIDNDSNITGLKSHDCYIMMQRLLPVGVRGYLDANISAPIIELCSFFKQVYARSLVVDDMRKAENQLVKILCNMELIFPPAFFDIMIHLVLHLPEEAILGGPVYMRWMYPFERYMKKLKNYVRNKAKPEGSIAEGYIADEALTFCSMYFEGVQTRFNRPDRNEDVVVPRRQLSVFESQCRATSKKTIISLGEEVCKTIEWFVLNNCHEIDVYKEEFKSEMRENDAQNKFAAWFKDKICNLQLAESRECTEELLALAHGPDFNAYSYTACVVNGVRFVVHSRDIRRTTQNSGVAVPGTDGFMFYGQLEDIIEIRYLSGYSVVLFRCKWFNTDPRKKRCTTKNNITSISVNSEWFKSDPYILATQAKQVFYIEDPSENHNWRVVEDVNHRKIWDHPSINEVNDIDVVHNNISSNFVLSAELDDMADIGLERVGQSSVVDDICTIHTADDTDFINDEDEEADVEHLDNDDVDSDNDVVDGYYSSDESD